VAGGSVSCVHYCYRVCGTSEAAQVGRRTEGSADRNAPTQWPSDVVMTVVQAEQATMTTDRSPARYYIVWSEKRTCR